MNLAAIDIGTNSIHMIIVKVTSRQTFEVLVQEKEMVKLGVGVFKNKKINEKAFEAGISTITRYVKLADQYGVEEIITAATSATREAKNGREFLDRLIEDVGLVPQLISGKEESRLIFLAVKKALDLKGENVMVLDIGGGSTEAVVGNQNSVLLKSSLKLGVLRLLDRVGNQDAMDTENRELLRQHICETAGKIFEVATAFNFTQVIGTSGTIRTLGEACLTSKDRNIINSVNAEVVKTRDLEKLVAKLLDLNSDKRSGIAGINENRSDAIHLGGLLLVELLHMAKADEIILCDASLREGLIIDYLEKNGQKLEETSIGTNVRERSSLLLASRYDTDLEAKKHVISLATQLFDQLDAIHGLNGQHRELLGHACLVYDVGLFVNFQNYQKHSRYIILNSGLRGFNNEEILILSHLARYHRKTGPKKRHRKFKAMDKKQRRLVRKLSGILRIAVGLDKTKNQWVERLECDVEEGKISIKIYGEENLDMEIWEAQRYADTLSGVLKKEIEVVKG